jgi:hypothetical protein
MKALFARLAVALLSLVGAVSAQAQDLLTIDWATAKTDISGTVAGGTPIAMWIFAGLMGLSIIFILIKKARGGGR